MCFVIDYKDSAPKIAKRNIVCYKILDNNLVSICFNFQYEIGKTYKHIDLVATYEWGCYNAYIEKGYHSYIKIYNACYDNKVVVKCHIPKGAIYYKNKERNEYVSSQIKIVEKCVL